MELCYGDPSRLIQEPKQVLDFLGGSAVKSLPANAGDSGLIPGLGRAPGEGKGSPRQYSCLGNPTDRGAWRAIARGVTKNQT